MKITHNHSHCKHDALKFIDKEQLIVAPDCGLGHLPRDLAKTKLKIMVEASNSF